MLSRQGMIQRGKRFCKQLLGKDLWTRPQIRGRKEYLGTDYAGYCICPDAIRRGSVVYSVGIGEDISFDRALIARWGVEVFAFDPTPKSIAWVKSQKDLPKQLHFYEWGLADFDGLATFNAPSNPSYVSYSLVKPSACGGQSADGQVYRLATLMGKLGHKKVDILKMDIEGGEYAVLTDVVDSGLSIGQVLLEFHPDKVDAGLRRTAEAIRRLNKAGYLIFHISPSGHVYAFLQPLRL